MTDTELDQYMQSLRESAASAGKSCPEGSPGYFKRLLNALSGNPCRQALYEKALAQAVKEEDHAGLQRIFYHIAKITLLPSRSGYDHCDRLWPLLDLLACADADNLYRVLPEGLPPAANGYPMYIHGANVLLCLLYNTGDKTVYAQEQITAKAEKFTTSKKAVWERAVVSCLLAILYHDSDRLSESLKNLCTGFHRADIAPYRKMQCQNAYGLLMLARRFWTAEEFAAVTWPDDKNFSQGYARWLLAQEQLPDELCVSYEAPLTELNAILKKPVPVTRIYQKYLGSDNPHLSNAEKKAWYLDVDGMMEELLGAAPGTLREQEDAPENSTASSGLSEDELKKLQRYIGHNTDELSAEQIIAHIEKINTETPLTRENWEKLLIPACGNQNIEVLVYALDRAGEIGYRAIYEACGHGAGQAAGISGETDRNPAEAHTVYPGKRKDQGAVGNPVVSGVVRGDGSRPFPDWERCGRSLSGRTGTGRSGTCQSVPGKIRRRYSVSIPLFSGHEPRSAGKSGRPNKGRKNGTVGRNCLRPAEKPVFRKRKTLTEKQGKCKILLHNIKREIRRRIRRLRENRVEAYYHPKQGYLIIASAVQKDSAAWLSVPPLETAAAETSPKELGAKAAAYLQKQKKVT